MKKNTNTYRLPAIWLLLAVFVNLLFPSAMEAALLFCDNTSSVESVETHNVSSCWLDTESDAPQTNLSHDNCSQIKLCEEALKTGLSEAPITHHENLHISGVLLTKSEFNTYFKPVVKVVSDFSQEILQVREIYLLNSVFLN